MVAITLSIAILFLGVIHAQAANICIPHYAGQLPPGKIGTVSVLPASNPHPGASGTRGTACITADPGYAFKDVYCEVGQDGPNNTFDGPYSCTGSCQASSGYYLDGFVVWERTERLI